MKKKVTVEMKNGFLCEAGINEHTCLMDNSKGTGGDYLGPTPYEMFLASMGACVVMTMRSYASMKGFDLQGASAEVVREKITDETGGKRDRISVDVVMSGDLSEAQRERLKFIGGQCSIKRFISNGEVVLSFTDQKN